MSKIAYQIRDEATEEWKWVARQNAFVNLQKPDRLYSWDVFNRKIRPFSDVDDTARLMVKHPSAICDDVVYRPGGIAGVIHEKGRRLVNTFRPAVIKPIKAKADKFVEFMEYLVPVETDRHETLRYVTTLVTRPDVRMTYSLLTQSLTQGVGKTTLAADICAPLVGPWNVSYPDEETIVSGKYTGWAAHKRLAVISEIYAGHDKKVYNYLKKIVSDHNIRVKIKYIEEYDVENCVHVMAASNSMHALFIEDEDRRWLVPRITEELRDKEYWIDFHDWLSGDGRGIILHHLQELAKKPGFLVRGGEHAPMTSLKEEMIDESRSESQKLVRELASRALALAKDTKDRKGRQVVLAMDEVQSWVANLRRVDDSREKPEKAAVLRRAMLAAGMKEPRLKPGEDRKRYTVNIKHYENDPDHKVKTYVVANYDIEEGAEWGNIQRFYSRSHEIWAENSESKVQI